MKYLLILIIVLFSMNSATNTQQNHVPNGSFEDTTGCPSSLGEMYKCANWISYTKTSPDYFNNCNTNSVGVPANQQGYQAAAHGNAYTGVITYYELNPNYDEYLKTSITPLETGKAYEVSMSVSLANESWWASNHLGVYFFDSGLSTVNTYNSAWSWATPQVSYASYGNITDTTNWIRLKKHMIADSAYDHIVIGDFKYNAISNPVLMQPNVFERMSYYYIDSVVVKEVKKIILDINNFDSILCVGDTFGLDIITVKKYNSNNIFTVQLSDKNGSFNNVSSIGSKTADTTCRIHCTIPANINNGSGYKLRVISSNTPDTSAASNVSLKIGNIDSANILIITSSPFCVGDTLKLSASTNVAGTTYQWTGPNSLNNNQQKVSIPNSSSTLNGNYYINLNFYGCSFKDTVLVTVHPIPATPVITHSSPLCTGETLQLNTTTVLSASYSWNGPGSYTSTSQNPTRGNMQFGDTGSYYVRVTVNNCISPAGTVKVNLNPVPFAVVMANPGDSICQGDPVVFTALPNNAGGAPQYRWLVNAQQVGTGTVFNASALSNGDVVRCDMTEYTKCNSPYTDQSNDIEMKVLPWLAPSVTISANPNRTLEVDEYVTFTATPTNGGPAPLYQWKRNGQNIQGATGSVWSANTLNDNDKITVELTSNYKCPQPPTAVSNSITVRVASSINNTDGVKGVTLYPNPNNGSFTIKGLLLNNDKISVQVMSGIGQLVYKQEITPINNTISENITLDGGLSSGVYFVKLVVNGEARVIPMTVSR